MRVGLGTGSTVAYLLPALAERELRDVRCVATSPATERAARALGLTVRALDEVGELDIAIDGADQIDPRGWLVKGGGGAHTREKIVAAAARRFVVIASAEKAVAELTPPVPLELLRFGVHSTLRALADARCARARLRERRPAAQQPRRRADRRLPRPGRRPARAGRPAERHPGRRRARPVRAGDGQRDPDRRRAAAWSAAAGAQAEPPRAASRSRTPVRPAQAGGAPRRRTPGGGRARRRRRRRRRPSARAAASRRAA